MLSVPIVGWRLPSSNRFQKLRVRVRGTEKNNEEEQGGKCFVSVT